MKAAVVRSDGVKKVLNTEDFTEPTAGPDEVVVRVRRVGICGSDLHGFSDPDDPSRAPGLIMGHEISGEISRVGPLVEAVSAGDRVTVDPQVRCGRCTPCRNGWFSICENKQVVGSSRRGFAQGGFAEYISVKAEQVIPIPDEVTFEQAALIEPLANGLHVVTRAEPSVGDLVVVLGAGTLGLSIVQAFRAAGVSTIVATDISDAKLAVAKELGATRTINVATEDADLIVRELSDGEGADIVVEAVGVEAVYRQAIGLVRRRGRVMFFGAAVPTIELDLLPILHKELLLVGCTGANMESVEAVDLVAQGAIDTTPMITHRFPLEEAQHAMSVLGDPASDAIKVMLRP